MNNQKKEIKPVNVYSDKEMIAAGFFRYADAFGDPAKVFAKTEKERKKWKSINRNARGDWHVPSAYRHYSPTTAKLIIQLKKNKKFPNTTYSKMCNKSFIPEALAKFTTDKGKNLVAWYSFNGKRVCI